MNLKELSKRLDEIRAEIIEFGDEEMADFAEVRVAAGGGMERITEISLDGNGHIYIDAE